MRPEYVYRRKNTWFAMSWNYRDLYLDISLRRLHWFRDVMPQVVVIGDYSIFEPSITTSSINGPDDIGSVFETVARTLEAATEKCEADYERVFQDFRVSRSKSRNLNIDEWRDRLV